MELRSMATFPQGGAPQAQFWGIEAILGEPDKPDMHERVFLYLRLQNSFESGRFCLSVYPPGPMGEFPAALIDLENGRVLEAEEYDQNPTVTQRDKYCFHHTRLRDAVSILAIAKAHDRNEYQAIRAALEELWDKAASDSTSAPTAQELESLWGNN